MFSYLIGEAGSAVGTVIVRKTRAQRDSIRKIKYRLNEVVWHKMKIEIQSFALHLHI